MKSITNFLLVALILTCCQLASYAQLKPGVASVSNVDFTFNGLQINITYNLNSGSKSDEYFVWCDIFSGNDKRIEAKSFSGDVWGNVKAGEKKKIIWDFKSDGVRPTDEVYIKISAAAKENYSVGGALLTSTIFPGMGATRVTKKNGPLLWGALGYSSVIGSGALALYSNSVYENYKTNPVAANFDKAVMLRNAAIGAAGTAATIWIINYFVTGNKVIAQNKVQPNYQEYLNDNRLMASTSPIKIVDTKLAPEKLYAQKSETSYIDLESDVNKNIPTVKDSPKPYRFALIFGNEDYASKQTGLQTEANVAFARTDAYYFKEYCEKVLGVPKDNIIFELDATAALMKRSIARMNKIMNAYGTNQAELIFYFAGHGFPDKDQNAYIIPTDVTGSAITEGIKLADLYRDLTQDNPKMVTVFLDACFSGGGRNAGLLAARAVKVTPRSAPISNNLIVFSASSNDQKANPYNEVNHGLFTYFLLKKLQETEGKVTLSDLADYLKRRVQGQSLRSNMDEQTPEVNVSSSIISSWEDLKLR
jgi:hypothetical protein